MPEGWTRIHLSVVALQNRSRSVSWAFNLSKHALLSKNSISLTFSFLLLVPTLMYLVPKWFKCKHENAFIMTNFTLIERELLSLSKNTRQKPSCHLRKMPMTLSVATMSTAEFTSALVPDACHFSSAKQEHSLIGYVSFWIFIVEN